MAAGRPARGSGELPIDRDPSRIEAMFGGIARRYDLMNRLMTVGLDGRWRRAAAAEAHLAPGDEALDACCGTGDLALTLSVTCPGCALVLPARSSDIYSGYYHTSAECWALYTEVLGSEFSDVLRFASSHQLTVDTYALQHSEDHGPRSNAVHLLDLCMILGHGADARIGANPPWFGAWVQADRALPYLEPPADRGGVTVATVYEATSPAEHVARVWLWARTVWEAWGAHHDWARAWLRAR